MGDFIFAGYGWIISDGTVSFCTRYEYTINNTQTLCVSCFCFVSFVAKIDFHFIIKARLTIRNFNWNSATVTLREFDVHRVFNAHIRSGSASACLTLVRFSNFVTFTLFALNYSICFTLEHVTSARLILEAFKLAAKAVLCCYSTGTACTELCTTSSRTEIVLLKIG